MTNKKFCQIHNSISGDKIDNPSQLTAIAFSGLELKEYIIDFYLSNKTINKKLFIVDCQNGNNLLQVPVFANNQKSAYSKIKKQYPLYKPIIIDSEIDLSFVCE